MNRLTLLLVSILFSSKNFAHTPLHKLVNTFIGTGGHGHTFPGPLMPFGACQLSPDTRLEGWDGCSGYHYSDSLIYGFSHTHLSGTGCSDYGDILVMPAKPNTSLLNYAYASAFSHQQEKAHAGYYRVFLDKAAVLAELSSTLHGGVHQYTYPKGQQACIVLDLKHRDQLLDSKMKQLDEFTMQGYRFSKAWAQQQKVFFTIRFSQPIDHIEFASDKKSLTHAQFPEKATHALIYFKMAETAVESSNKLTVCCAISGVDEEGSMRNLHAEMPHNLFEKYKEENEATWDQELSVISLPPVYNKPDDYMVFYTALYHCMIHPSLYSDVDGRYRGRDDLIHNTGGRFNYYSVFSLWDTYRALHPLLSWLDPVRTRDFIQTFLCQYKEGGRLPIWELSSQETNCMIGYHVVSVIWDAWQRGIRDFDAHLALQAMMSIATGPDDYLLKQNRWMLREQARPRCADADAQNSYQGYAYIRADDAAESVSKTIEYAYDDWCIARMAESLGKDSLAVYYYLRSKQWMNLYDPSTGFMRARKNASLYQPFSPYTVDNNYTEANSWQYSFYVPHDIQGLIELQGGPKAFEKKLDDLFSADTQTEGREQADITGLIGQYAHGNEPSHHTIYLYNYVGRPEKTDSLVQKVMREFYHNSPEGLIGNEDCGQMSAWYVCSALGMYPVCPGSGYLDITRPAFPRYTIKHKTSQDQIVLTSSDSNGPNRISTHLLQKPILEIPLKRKQEIIKAAEQYDKPKSLQEVANRSFISTPFLEPCPQIFKDSVELRFNAPGINGQLYYSLNNGPEKRIDGQSVTIRHNSQVKFYQKKGIVKSPQQEAIFTELPSDRSVTLNSKYSKSYHAGGAEGMIDGIHGKLNWRAGDWQGYQGQDADIVITLNKARSIEEMQACFLEDQNSWIFYPKKIIFSASQDSIHWDVLETIETRRSDHNLESSISTWGTRLKGKTRYRFAKLHAETFGPMPDWHEGRGNPTYIFIDEFTVK